MWLILCCFLLVAGCQARSKTQPISSNQDSESELPADFLFSLKRTVCFGRCPAYEFQVNAKGELTWQGHYFVTHLGTYRRALKPKEVFKLYQRLEQSHLEHYQPIYDDPAVSDLPSTILRYQAHSRSTEVVCRYGCPNSLISLFRELEALVDTTGMQPLK